MPWSSIISLELTTALHHHDIIVTSQTRAYITSSLHHRLRHTCTCTLHHHYITFKGDRCDPIGQFSDEDVVSVESVRAGHQPTQPTNEVELRMRGERGERGGGGEGEGGEGRRERGREGRGEEGEGGEGRSTEKGLHDIVQETVTLCCGPG